MESLFLLFDPAASSCLVLIISSLGFGGGGMLLCEGI